MPSTTFKLAGATAAAAILSFGASMAQAQESGPVPTNAAPADSPMLDPDANTLTIGLGAGVSSSYEGSDHYRVIPGGALLGRYAGHDFILRGLQLYIDAIPNDPDRAIDISAGPVVGIRLNRTGDVSNDQVEALGELNTAWEVGGYASVGTTGGVFNPYDSLSVRVTYLKDVASAHESHIVTPAIEYGTPISRKTYLRAYVSADFVGDGYASYYFDVTPAGSAVSGLRPYSAEGGFKNWTVGLLAAHSFKGLGKGPSLFAVGTYSRLQGDFARSPLVADIGSPNQFFGAAGLAWTF